MMQVVGVDNKIIFSFFILLQDLNGFGSHIRGAVFTRMSVHILIEV